MSTFVNSLSDAIRGWGKGPKTFDVIGVYIEMLLESVFRSAAVPNEPNANSCKYVFDTNGHASLVIRRDKSGVVYGPDDKHLTQHIQEFLDADFSQEICHISRMFTETNKHLSTLHHFKAWILHSTPIQPFFGLLSEFCETPPRTLSFLHNPLFVPHFRDLHLSFVEENPGPSGDEFIPSSLIPSPFKLSSIKDPNSHPLLRSFFTKLCAFPGKSSILMAFRLVSPSDLADLNNILHPSPTLHLPPRPFLLPLSQPCQSKDGIIFVKSLGNMIPLSKFTEFLISGKIPVSSHTVVMWYIQCVLGVEARFNLHLAESPLQQDDIVVDSFFRFHINPLPSLSTCTIAEETTYSLSLIVSLVESDILPSIILEDLDFFPSIQSPNPKHIPSFRLKRRNQWISDILMDLQDWYRGKQIPGFDHPRLFNSLSLLISQLLSEYRPLLDIYEESHWNDFLNTLTERAAGEQKEYGTMFLADDIFKSARESLFNEAEKNFRDLGGINHLMSSIAFPHSGGSTDTETKTASYQSDPKWGRDDTDVYALKADEYKSRSTAKLSLESNTLGSSELLSQNPLASQSQDGEFQEPLLSRNPIHPVKLSPILIESTDPVREDDEARHSRQAEEERQIKDSLDKITKGAKKQHKFTWNFSISPDLTINFSQIDMTETFDHTLFDTIDNEEIDKSLLRCLYILQKTERADHIQIDDIFVASLCDCLGGDDETCCPKSYVLLLVLYEHYLKDSQKQQVLKNLKDAFVDQNQYQAGFLIRVHSFVLRRNTDTFSYSDVNWEHVSLFEPTDYNVRLRHMVFVSDAVAVFRNRCSLDIFDPHKIVRRLVEYYHPFSLTHEEITKFGETDDIDPITRLFASIIVFSITLNQTLSPRIIELYATTEIEYVDMRAVSLFLIPLTRNLGTRPLSYLLLERFIRQPFEVGFSQLIYMLSLGVMNNHFDTTSLPVFLHPFFISHLFHLDIVRMVQVQGEHFDKAIHILRSAFVKSATTDGHDMILYATHPPPQFGRFLDFLFTFHTKSQTLDVTTFLLFTNYIFFCSPFGEGRLFRRIFGTLFSPLTPKDSLKTERLGLETTICWLQLTNTWLPKGFDNPLLWFLTPSTLSNRRLTNDELSKLKAVVDGREQWLIKSIDDGSFPLSRHLEWRCVVARMGHWNFRFLEKTETDAFVQKLLVDCFSPYPAIVSLALIALSNIVSSTGPTVHRILCQMDTIDVVISSVDKSSHLEDYENGICVIGILLRSIRDFRNKKEMVDHDFADLPLK
ncbi:hypothetical protein BLNAU_18611 [Blattamonas nauphoetae]|uniref:Uncharacterized protein n=1 Tax=Blattamonas nauphoetae TaxID=2049346 RepID=A0ABQ9X3U8_9EUKA|nr:hypothetical protein BLNAU_18611 [Blattamonas nauphoetae]